MSNSLQKLLRYFQDELVMNDALRADFAQRHPALANALGAGGTGAEQDPHLQRLLQSIALMNAHTAMRIDASRDWLTDALLHMNYPHYLRPFPSCTIIHFDAERDGSKPNVVQSVMTVDRGTMLLCPFWEQVRCQFRTVYPVTIAPIRIAAARFSSVLECQAAVRFAQDVTHFISISLESTASAAGIGELGLDLVRLFVDAETAMCAQLCDTLTLGAACAWLQCGDAATWTQLRQVPLRPVGYSEDEAIVPHEARSHPAFRLLAEYGCFPDKFNFLGLDLAACAQHIPAACRRMTLHFGIKALRHDSDTAHVLSKFSREHLRLFCTPAVNLMCKAAGAILLDHTKTEYVVTTDAAIPRAYDIYSVDRVTTVQRQADDKVKTEQYRPYFSLKHGRAGGRDSRYYYIRRRELIGELSPGYEHRITLVDLDFNPLDTQDATVSIDLTCTNRDIPHGLPIGAPGGDLSMAEPLGGIRIRMLRQPTRSYRFSAKDHWRLISQLSLAHHSLVQDDVAPLAELLTLYNLPQSPENFRQIEGIVAVCARPAHVKWRQGSCSGYTRGTEVRLTVDRQAYSGCGLHAFVQVLEHFFGLYVHINSFVQLVVLCHQSRKEILRCPPRSGSLLLL